MNKNLIPIYNLIKDQVNQFNFSKIFNQTIALGISSYLNFSHSDLEIDYAKILLEAYGGSLLDQRSFIDFLITSSLNDNYINIFSSELNLTKSTNGDFPLLRKFIMQKPLKKIKKTIIDVYNLDAEYFETQIEKTEIWEEEIKPFTPVPKLRKNIPNSFLCLHDYQKRIKNDLTRTLLLSNPNSRALVHMPTGSGKTKTSIESIIDFIRVNASLEQKASIIWFAHKKELCEQAYDTFKEMWQFKGDSEISMFKIFDKSPKSILSNLVQAKLSIVFIGFQKFTSLRKPKSDLDSEALHYLSTHTKLVIVDEAHKSLAPTYKSAIDFVSEMPDCRLIGLTATPGRSNFLSGDSSSESLVEYFHDNIINVTNEKNEKIDKPLSYLQSINVLAKVEVEELEFNHDINDLDYNSKKILENIEEEISIDPIRNIAIADQIEKYYKENKSILLFASSTSHCEIIKRILTIRNITSEVILGNTDSIYRTKYINDFKSKKLRVLINYGVLSTGFDAPKLNVLIIARPTNSIILYSQMLGRALRGKLNGGNSRNKLITIKDNITGYPDSDFLFSYWEDLWN